MLQNNYQNYLERRIDPNDKFNNLLTYPKFIEIETVNACNARCPMCTINDWERNYPIMKDDVFKKIADDLIKNRHYLKRVSLYRDGEPLVDKKIPQRIKYLKDNKIENVTIATNVSLLNKKRSEMILEAGLDQIIFSIDSLKKDVFENIRVRLNFDVVLENAINFFKLRDEINPNCRIWVRMIRQETNKDEWNDYKNFWLKYAKPIDRIYYHDIFNWGGQLENFKAVSKSYEPNLPCVALWSLMVFFANGDVPLCNVDYNNKFPTGSILKNSVQELWQSKVMNIRREMHLNNEKNGISICRNCNVWDENHGEEMVSPEFAEKVSVKNTF